jgi:oligoribonuclease
MLFWMDLEMTGLDPSVHVIVEIATLVTDDDLNVIAEGPDLVIHHTESGLLEAIRTSTVTHDDAMRQTLEFMKLHSPEPRKIPLAGNSIGTDRRFLARYMPEIEDWLHYRVVDVSSVKELVKRWYPGLEHARGAKGGMHRAMDDVRDSIEELRFYRERAFRAAADGSAK